MSRASERKAMRSALAGYSLMGVPEVAAFLDCSEATARELVDKQIIPSTRVGGRDKCDPVDVVVHLLAGREGMKRSDGQVDAAAYWLRHGEAVAEHVRRYIGRIRKLQGAA